MKEKTIQRIWDFFHTPVEKPGLLEADNSIDELYALCDDPMQYPVKLIDEQLRFTDLTSVQELFVENTGFLVVGVVGLQGCGKSSLLNILANRLVDNTTPINGPFKTQTINNIITNSPQTGGVDLYITQDRVILLDTQPLMSLALTNYHVRIASSASGAQLDITATSTGDNTAGVPLTGPGGWLLDVWAEMVSLQIVAFLLNCCHVVLVVSDDVSNAPTQLHQLIDRAACLKPTVYTQSVLPPSARRRSRLRAQIGKTQATTVSAPSNSRQGCPSTVDTSKCDAATTKIWGVYNGSNSQTDEDDEIEVGDDQVAGITVNFAAERNRTARSASDEPDITVTPSGLLQPHRASSTIHRDGANLEMESDDVAVALNRLQSLTDYSASLIHVYNMAPSAAFLDPVVCSKLKTYQHELLPMLYPETRRLGSMVTLGSRILSAHLATSRRRSRRIEKEIAATVPTENPVDVTNRDIGQATTGDFQPDAISSDLSHQLPNAMAITDESPQPSAIPAHSVSTQSNSPTELDAIHRSRSKESAAKQPSEKAQSVTTLGSQHSKSSDPIDRGTGGTHEKEKEECNKSETGGDPLCDSVKSQIVPPIATSQPSLASQKQNMESELVIQSTNENVERTATVSSQQTNGTAPSTNPTGPYVPSEAELVAELRSVLNEVENEVEELLKAPFSISNESSSTSRFGRNGDLDSPLSSDEDDIETTDQLDGEQLNAQLAHITHRIRSIRRQFFDVQQRLNNPRFFLIPEVDADGNAPTGCPSYSSSVRLLQEAILSTPRQHMMVQFTEREWIAYTKKMWEAVCESPLFTDYHAILTNRI